MSEYKGLYVQRLSDGTIFNVQVEDSHGYENALDPKIYIEREIEPDINSLPTK